MQNMPKLYCRVNPRTNLEKRDRAGLRFTRNWRELDGIDDATLDALQEDQYLEVSDTPTVMVEVAAATQAGAIETAQDLNNPPESEAIEGSTGESAAEGADTGTASPVANAGEANLGGNSDEQNAQAGAADGDAAGQSVDESGQSAATQTAMGDAQTEAQKAAEVLDQRRKQIAAAIGALDQSNPEHWLKDGRPNAAAISMISGVTVTAEERDAVWAFINKGAE